MREILFRGKRKDNGEWAVSGNVFLGDKRKYIYIPNPDTDMSAKAYLCREIIPDTVGQYTGLTDKNGTKVFEGDILKFTDTNAEYEWIGKVEFGNPNAEYNWGFQLVYISGAKPNTDILLWFDMEETGAYSEVIGNIHDNPELLKEAMADCKYYYDEFCVNDKCPVVADYCPVPDTPDVCRWEERSDDNG